MHLEVTFRNLRPREEIRRRAQALFEKLHRFLDPATEAQLVVSIERGGAVLEMTVSAHGQVFKAEDEDADMRTALDRLMHTIEGQLRRNKTKRDDARTGRRRRGGPQDGFGNGELGDRDAEE